jgi:hypothetical protein
MLEQLQKKPDHFFEISDEKKAKALLLELGLLDRFNKTSTLQTQVIASGKHVTHYVVAMFFSRKKKKDGHGYLVYCVPRKRFSPFGVAQLLEQIALKQDSNYSIRLLPDSVLGN